MRYFRFYLTSLEYELSVNETERWQMTTKQYKCASKETLEFHFNWTGPNPIGFESGYAILEMKRILAKWVQTREEGEESTFERLDYSQNYTLCLIDQESQVKQG